MADALKLLCILSFIIVTVLSYPVTKTVVSPFHSSHQTKAANTTGEYIQNTLTYYMNGASGYTTIDTRYINKYLSRTSEKRSQKSPSDTENTTTTSPERALTGFFNADLVISGFYTDNGDTISIKTSVFYRQTGNSEKIIVSGSSGIDLFDTIEELSLTLAKKISGQNIRFGTLQIKTTEPYTLFIDGKNLGVTPCNVPAGFGKHTMQLTNTAGTCVYNSEIEVTEEKPLVIDLLGITLKEQLKQTIVGLSSDVCEFKTSQILPGAGTYTLTTFFLTGNKRTERLNFHKTKFSIAESETIEKKIPATVDKKYYAMSFLPAVYQFYNKEYVRGCLFTSFMATGVTAAILAPVMWKVYYENTIRPYETALNNYSEPTSTQPPAEEPPPAKPMPRDSLITKATADSSTNTSSGTNPYSQTELDSLYKNGDIIFYSLLVSGIATFSLSWIISVIDALITVSKTKKILESDKKELPLKINFEVRLIQ